MISSIWRLSHLAFAFLASFILIILSVTGVILAYDSISDKQDTEHQYPVNSVSISELIQNIKGNYLEIIEVEVDYNGRVILDAYDLEGEQIKGYINPYTGEYIGDIREKSTFIQDVTTLHRSLFLHETGRIIIGIATFLFFLIAISGFVLILQRQEGVKGFFLGLPKKWDVGGLHYFTGKVFIIPILFISITGTFLVMHSLQLFQTQSELLTYVPEDANLEQESEDEFLESHQFPIFQELTLGDIQKIQFPFIEGDPEEFFKIFSNQKNIVVEQIGGTIIEEEIHPFALVYKNLGLNLHTGRTSIWWAIILGLASLNILYFIYSGFKITYKRFRSQVKIKSCDANEAEYVILVGSENGSTLFCAQLILKQLLQFGCKALVLSLNEYREFKNIKHLIILTSTYGEGTAPSNANKFENLVQSISLNSSIPYSILGFGSTSYSQFCQYAKDLDSLLDSLPYFERFMPVHTVNDKNVQQILVFIKEWNRKTGLNLIENESFYQDKSFKKQNFEVLENSTVCEKNGYFTIKLKPQFTIKNSFRSGDLLSVFPNNDYQERFYSISQINGNIQLLIKSHYLGLGSQYLLNLKKGEKIKARILNNTHFHFNNDAKFLIFIGNGAGLAPFLGLINENENKIPIKAYFGFRNSSENLSKYLNHLEEFKNNQKISDFSIVYSKEGGCQYVTKLLEEDLDFILKSLKEGGVIMMCGSKKMQKDVEDLLNAACLKELNLSVQDLKNKKQIQTDCY